jgi:Zn-dependent membrane protease YugP
LWEDRLNDEGAVSSINRGMLLEEGKETIGTSALDAAPDMILEMPEDSYAPVLLTAGISVLFVGMLLKGWALIGLGVALIAAALLFWMWPRRQLLEREPAHD